MSRCGQAVRRRMPVARRPRRGGVREGETGLGVVGERDKSQWASSPRRGNPRGSRRSLPWLDSADLSLPIHLTPSSPATFSTLLAVVTCARARARWCGSADLRGKKIIIAACGERSFPECLYAMGKSSPSNVRAEPPPSLPPPRFNEVFDKLRLLEFPLTFALLNLNS